MKHNTLLLIITFLFTGLISNAEDTISTSAKFPRVVLVELRSEHNRIEGVAKQKDYKMLDIVKHDAVEVNKAMINDFQDNFSFCPVYYFSDTNQQAILNREFDGVLMNADGSIVKDPILTDTSREYVIVFYGFPAPQGHREREVVSKSRYTTNSGEPRGRGLVISNYKMHQLSFLYKFEYNNFGYRMNRKKEYIYRSKKFDMQYFPMAREFSQKLTDRAKKIRIAHIVGMTDPLFD